MNGQAFSVHISSLLINEHVCQHDNSVTISAHNTEECFSSLGQKLQDAGIDVESAHSQLSRRNNSHVSRHHHATKHQHCGADIDEGARGANEPA